MLFQSEHYSSLVTVLINGEDSFLMCQLLRGKLKTSEPQCLFSVTDTHETRASQSDGLEVTGPCCRHVPTHRERVHYESHVLAPAYGRLETTLRLVTCSLKKKMEKTLIIIK